MASQFRASNNLLQVEMRFPARLRLRLDGDRIKQKAGTAVAAAVRRRIRAGRDGDGTALPRPLSGGKPLDNTGDLIRSIKYDRHRERVRAIGQRPDLGASLRGRREGLLAVLIHQRDIRPMEVDSKIQRVLVKAAQKEIDRQLVKGSAGLVGELRRIKG